MEQLLAFAKGPLFMVTFLIMIMGLGRQVVLQVHALILRKWGRLRDAPWKKIAADTLSWAFPVRHLIRGTVVFSIGSILFHIGAIAVSVFLADHVALWEGFLGIDLPAIGRQTADGLTLLAVGSLLTLLGWRTFVGRVRAMSRPGDYLLLFLLLLIFTSGYLASHPKINPAPWAVMMLTHVLSAELLFLLVPFTKLAHIVLFAFDRLSAVHWQLRPGAGDKVSEALFGDEARV
jgi:nitrate reductase gamma subunit